MQGHLGEDAEKCFLLAGRLAGKGSRPQRPYEWSLRAMTWSNSMMRRMIKDILKKNGFEVCGEAEDGVQAVERYKELRPDLTIMDIAMPKKDGIAAVREIKQIDAKAKIVMCSAMGQQAMVVDAIQAGALDFIVKPFQPDRVVEALRKALR
jgi:two-component system chemotaxis response regulator CheY